MTRTPTASPEHAPTAAPALVTLIVPGFDVEPYALEALDSLRAQSLTSWRAVLIDDASSDRTGEIFARAATEDGRFQVVTHDRRRGLGAARNTGLDRVDSEYLGFLDADDLMRPDALRRMVGTLQRSGSDFVAGAYVRLRPHPDGSYTSGEVQPWVSAATDPARERTTIEAHPEATSNIVAWSKLSRASFWTRTGLRFPEGRLYEDQLVAQRMYARADAFDVLPDVVVDWRVRADGSSITQREAALPVLHDCLRARWPRRARRRQPPPSRARAPPTDRAHGLTAPGAARHRTCRCRLPPRGGGVHARDLAGRHGASP